MSYVLNPTDAEVTASSGTSQEADYTIGPGQLVAVTCEQITWIAQGATGVVTAVADTDENIRVAAGQTVILHGKFGAKIAFIQETTAGQVVICGAIQL